MCNYPCMAILTPVLLLDVNLFPNPQLLYYYVLHCSTVNHKYMFQIGHQRPFVDALLVKKITRYIYTNLFDLAKNAITAKNIQCINTLLLSIGMD